MQNLDYLRNYPKESVQGLKDFTPRVHLRHENDALMAVIDELHASRMPANLGHSPN
jgi:hypothetical protein